MKTKMILLLLAAMTTLLACNKDDDGVDPNDPDAMRTIKLTLKISNYSSVNFDFEDEYDEYDEDIPFPTDLFIDWGDGSVTSSNSHKYNTSGTYNVTIQAKNLKYFGDYHAGSILAIDLKNCNSLVGLCLSYNSDLKTLDVSGLKALEYLGCSNNELEILDVSGLKALKYLGCSNNELSAEALNKIFNDLPQGKTWTYETGYKVQSEIEFRGNPGSKDCDISILEKKGWDY